MIKNYLTTAIRNLLRHPFFSFVNIFALAISMSFCLIVITIIKGQFEFDSFHIDKDRIYRVTSRTTTKDNARGDFATTPYPLAEELKRTSPSVVAAATIRPAFSQKTTFDTKSLDFTVVFTDASLFTIFDFPMHPSNVIKTFDAPGAVIISDESALKLFGNTDPVGKIITVGELGDYKIAGVLAKKELKTHLQYDLFLSAGSIAGLEQQHKIDSISNNWTNYTSSYTYIKTKDKSFDQQVSSNLTLTAAGVSRKFKITAVEKSIQFNLQKLSAITPGHSYFLENTTGLTFRTIYTIAALVLFLLVLTCFNYSNLTIARALTRTKEIGVRKVMGATRGQLFFQFVFESATLTFLALLVACIFIPFIPLNDAFRNLFQQTKIDASVIILFLIFAIVTGVLAGLLPGLILSKLRSVQVLTKLSNLKVFNVAVLNRILTIAQFSISCILIVTLFTMLRQSRFMHDGDYGFTFDNIVNLPRDSKYPYKILASEFSQVQGVKNVSGISTVFGYHPTGYYKISLANGNAFNQTAYYYADENVIDNFGLTITAGSNFWLNAPEQKANIVINARAVELFGLGTPDKAIGQVLTANDSMRLTVIGVVNDFHFENFKNAITPLILRYDQSKLQTINLQIEPARATLIYRDLQNKWNELKIQYPFEPDRMGIRLREEQSHMSDISFFAYFSLMILSISCLGILGMSAYSAETRTKEVSIRKVLGAGTWDIFRLLAREFCMLLSVAVIIGVPVGIFFSYTFLKGFAYKVPIGYSSVLAAIAGLLIIGILSFGSQIISSSVASPLKRLNNS